MARKERKRTPLSGIRRKLSYDNQDKDYVYRWVNDNDRRLQNAQEGGYEFVEKADRDDHAGADDVANENAGVGSAISKIVNRDGTKAYLMRIKKEWYEEDQREKQKIPDQIEAQIMRRDDDNARKLGDSVIGKVEIG